VTGVIVAGALVIGAIVLSAGTRIGLERELAVTAARAAVQLAAVGLIVGERRGRWVWWRIVPERMAQLHDSLGVGAPVSAG
jgi:hypothetical protein